MTSGGWKEAARALCRAAGKSTSYNAAVTLADAAVRADQRARGHQTENNTSPEFIRLVDTVLRLDRIDKPCDVCGANHSNCPECE